MNCDNTNDLLMLLNLNNRMNPFDKGGLGQTQNTPQMGQMPNGFGDKNKGFNDKNMNNFNSIKIEVDEEMANALVKLAKQINPNSTTTKETLMNCDNTNDLLVILNLNNRMNLFDKEEWGQVPNMPQMGQMPNNMGNDQQMETTIEFYMNDKVNTFGNVRDTK